MPVSIYKYESVPQTWNSFGRSPISIVPPEPPAGGPNWTEENPPWEYTSSADWEASLPSGVPVVDLSATGATFWDKLNNTQAAQSGRFICRLGTGRYTLTSFRTVGSSGNPTYAFGFFFPKLAGFVGNGPDNTIIEMAADSVSTAQLDHMKTMTQASFIQLLMGMCRIDTQYNSVAAPVYLGGVGFEADAQNELTEISSDITNNVYVPQSAPHLGVAIYSDSSRRHPDTIVTHCRFRGAGKAMTSQPPFELGNITSQRNDIRYRNCEFDGRMSPFYDATQPRKCNPWMANGGVVQDMKDCWMHHSNISRYAANDESVVSGTALTNHYRLVGVKLEQLANNQNRQPPINGGDSLGGYTNVSNIGFESSNALIEIEDCYVSVDNPYTDGQIPCHIQLTNTGAARSGGRLYVVGGEFHHTEFAQLDGYVTFRIQPTSNWWTDGFNTTLDVRKTAGGARLLPYQVTGTWPPSQAALDGAGVSPDTHYLVRST